jgi:hypothetical protein
MFAKEILIKDIPMLKMGDLRLFAVDLMNKSWDEILKKRLGELRVYLEIKT